MRGFLLARLLGGDEQRGDPEAAAYLRDPASRPDVNAVSARFPTPRAQRGRVVLPPPPPPRRRDPPGIGVPYAGISPVGVSVRLRPDGPELPWPRGMPRPTWNDLDNAARDLAGHVRAFPGRAMGLPGAGYRPPHAPYPRAVSPELDDPAPPIEPMPGERLWELQGPFLAEEVRREMFRTSPLGVEGGPAPAAPVGVAGRAPPLDAEYETTEEYRRQRGPVRYEAHYSSRPANAYGGHRRTSDVELDPIPEPPADARREVGPINELDLDAEWNAAMARAQARRKRVRR